MNGSGREDSSGSPRCDEWQADGKGGTDIGYAVDLDAAPECLHDQVVGDVQAKTRAAAAHASADERVEYTLQQARGNTAAIVADPDAHALPSLGHGDDAKAGVALTAKGMDHGIADQVGEYLAEGAWVAVEEQAEGHINADSDAVALEERLQSDDDFLAYLVQGEFPPLGTGLVGCNLLETGDQFSRPNQIARSDVGSRIHGLEQSVETGSFQALHTLLSESSERVAQGGHGHDAIAQRRVQFVGNAGDQGAKGRQFLGTNQFILGEPRRFELIAEVKF